MVSDEDFYFVIYGIYRKAYYEHYWHVTDLVLVCIQLRGGV